MKEFGLYVVKPNYMMQFSSYVIHFRYGNDRRFVCRHIKFFVCFFVIKCHFLSPLNYCLS